MSDPQNDPTPGGPLTNEVLAVVSHDLKEPLRAIQNFSRMVDKGYTAKQVRLLCEWYLRVRKSS